MSGGPREDEIEIMILGPGFGECVIIHYGENHWFIVDSCIGRGDASAAAVSYLESIGVSPADAVDLLLITHYHSDHIGGLLSLVTACPRATFAFSPGAEPEKFVTFIGAFQKSPAIDNGTSELYHAFALVEKRNQQFYCVGRISPYFDTLAPKGELKRKSHRSLLPTEIVLSSLNLYRAICRGAVLE